MVFKTSMCRFSGLRIYPGHGITYIRTDGQQWIFLSAKAKCLYNQRKRPAKIAWSAAYRKSHKKDQTAAQAKKKKRTINKAIVRPLAGASLEVINKKRNEKPEARKASREAALRQVKEKLKTDKAEKAAQKAAQQAQQKVAAKAGKR